ncbi:hypothetical protein P280DRAFT_482950 [Massarina eburnea CBS 473.64]|uniref:PAS domain-containing protein n=1 Tax=Massarina eburnea CBS 473.64 TaxID=1395130 RepID=A0A6A6RQ50_9PLEO|nr:hypothetical protein P280DRAFT_482950 [Massarina eburnea CBS 473.64]
MVSLWDARYITRANPQLTATDLTDEARVLYSSDSIVDILGHTPDEVVNRSAWDFFHPDEVPVAKKLHSRGVKLDKAAVLSYCRIRNRQGDWVGCESCFSIVYDVMVCCTSVYRLGAESQKRAMDAPLVRRLFTSSPEDPRYHMLSHLSSKFSLGAEEQTHEPRAALFLNRFTRTLSIMYATSGIEQVIGISNEEMLGRSFYFCIQEDCLRQAAHCLEAAKGNDSIAYLRFMFRDPRQEDPAAFGSEDDDMTDVTTSEDESEAGTENQGPSAPARDFPNGHSSSDADGEESAEDLRSSVPPSPFSEAPAEPIELEAVISCTTDGLVVCLRRARPMIPNAQLPSSSHHQPVFAAPWGVQPVFQPALPQQPPYPLGAQHPAMALTQPGPVQSAFMQSIRDVGVFAWALVGINGSFAEYSRGKPAGESQPPYGFPVWDPMPGEKVPAPPSGYVSGSGSSSSADPWGFGDPGLR